MRVALQIPIKSRQSTRVPNKNFRDLGGKPLSYWLLDRLVETCPPDWTLVVDSESSCVWDRLKDRYGQRMQFHQREPWYASDEANGNHLIHQFAVFRADFDLYVQAYVTAVTLPGEIVVEAVEALMSRIDQFDSMTLVTEETGWFWRDGQAVNYRPDQPAGLPRSQDAMMLKETTGVYAISKEALLRYGCRLGSKPLLYHVPKKYAVDIDTMEDFREAQKLITDSSDRHD